MIRTLKLAAFTVVCFALVAAPAFGAKGGGNTASISFASAGSATRLATPTVGSSVSFGVTASVRPDQVASLWVANICSTTGVIMSAEYHPVVKWVAGPFTVKASSCTAYVALYPDVWTALKGGSMTYAVTG